MALPGYHGESAEICEATGFLPIRDFFSEVGTDQIINLLDIRVFVVPFECLDCVVGLGETVFDTLYVHGIERRKGPPTHLQTMLKADESVFRGVSPGGDDMDGLNR
jgi:hypothetical protein